MTDRCAECTCQHGGVYCNWIASTPQEYNAELARLTAREAALIDTIARLTAERDAVQAEVARREMERKAMSARIGMQRKEVRRALSWANACQTAMFKTIEELNIFKRAAIRAIAQDNTP